MDVKGVEVIYFAHENYERTTYMVHFSVVDKKNWFFCVWPYQGFTSGMVDDKKIIELWAANVNKLLILVARLKN